MGGYDGYLKDCPSCAGTGGVYVTERGARAIYPGGSFLGRDNDHREWLRGSPITADERTTMSNEATTTDQSALDQIAGLLGLYYTDPGNNPVDELIASIAGWVRQTGRNTDIPEGA